MATSQLAAQLYTVRDFTNTPSRDCHNNEEGQATRLRRRTMFGTRCN